MLLIAPCFRKAGWGHRRIELPAALTRGGYHPHDRKNSHSRQPAYACAVPAYASGLTLATATNRRAIQLHRAPLQLRPHHPHATARGRPASVQDIPRAPARTCLMARPSRWRLLVVMRGPRQPPYCTVTAPKRAPKGGAGYFINQLEHYAILSVKKETC